MHDNTVQKLVRINKVLGGLCGVVSYGLWIRYMVHADYSTLLLTLGIAGGFFLTFLISLYYATAFFAIELAVIGIYESSLFGGRLFKVKLRASGAQNAHEKAMEHIRKAGFKTTLLPALPFESWTPIRYWRPTRVALGVVIALTSICIWLPSALNPLLGLLDVLAFIAMAYFAVNDDDTPAVMALERIGHALTPLNAGRYSSGLDTEHEFRLPEGGPLLVFPEYGDLTLGIHLPELSFHLVKVSQDTLDINEFKVGDPHFDRSTVLYEKEGPRADLWTTRLTPPVRAVLLWLCSQGAEVDSQTVRVSYKPSIKTLQHLQDLIVALSGLRGLIDRQPKDCIVRAKTGLEMAQSDARIECILRECGRLQPEQNAQEILEYWSNRGKGDSVLVAASMMPDVRTAIETLNQFLKSDRTADFRAAAMMTLLAKAPEAGVDALVRWTLADEVECVQALTHNHSAALYAQRDQLSGPLQSMGDGIAAVLLLATLDALPPNPQLDQWLQPPKQPTYAHLACLTLAMERVSAEQRSSLQNASETLKILLENQRGGLELAENRGGALAISPE